MDLVVWGLGYVGLPIAVSAAKNGYKVYGYDINVSKVENLSSGKSFSPEISNESLLEVISNKSLVISTKLPVVDTPAVHIIAVPTPLNKNGEPDLSFLRSSCEDIAKIVNPGSLIINESTSYIGTLRNLIQPIIESISGVKDLKFAVAPERIDPGNLVWNVWNTPRVVGGLSEEATNEAFAVYSKFCGTVHKVSSPEVAEAAKLIENSFRQVNIALINELSDISYRLNFSIIEAIEAAATKPFGYMPFYPGIGVGGHCIPVDPVYLSFSAKSVGTSTRLIDMATEINSGNPKSLAKKIENMMENSLAGKSIQVAGVSYKINTSDTRESPVIQLILELRNLGAIVTWHDPLIESFENEKSFPLSLDCDLGIIAVPHDSINFEIWKNSDLLVLDMSTKSKDFGFPKFF
jgi:UDP-N-acetyl-D-glucosamine dehydrogenase